MGFLTRSELREELRTGLGERTDQSDARLNRWLYQGLVLISMPSVRRHDEIEAEFNITLSTDVNSYNMVTTAGFQILGIKEVQFHDATTISPTNRVHDVRPRDRSWFNSRTLVDSTGGPRHYYRAGANIVFNPITHANDNGKLVRMCVWRSPANFTDDTSVSPLLDYFDPAIILAAQYFAELRLGYRELSVHTRQEMQSYVNQLDEAGEMDDDTDQRMELRHESPMPIA